MKTRYLFGLLALFVFVAGGCTKDQFIKSGLSKGRFDGSLLEHMEAPGHSYDWDSTALMVRHAGEKMVRLFEGQDPDHPEITFLGPTNHSIRRYMLENNIERVADMDPLWCEEVLLRHVLDRKLYRDDIPRGKKAGGIIEGGMECLSLGGKGIYLFTMRGSYGTVQEAGAVRIYCVVKGTNVDIDIASSNIEPNHCVVHSLGYNFTLNRDL